MTGLAASEAATAAALQIQAHIQEYGSLDAVPEEEAERTTAAEVGDT